MHPHVHHGPFPSFTHFHWLLENHTASLTRTSHRVQEKNLSPRLVKLRYDFFEAKRRDLLAAARRARDALLADEKREKVAWAARRACARGDSG